jgi:hypothetical protein
MAVVFRPHSWMHVIHRRGQTYMNTYIYIIYIIYKYIYIYCFFTEVSRGPENYFSSMNYHEITTKARGHQLFLVQNFISLMIVVIPDHFKHLQMAFCLYLHTIYPLVNSHSY